jgi:NAD(P)-dependent dehydrogenase (short-subunit alcohol dehydrogenase family)
MAIVLVTGSSSGFGNLITLTLARRGHTVFATMRAPEGRNRSAATQLRKVASAAALPIRVLALDITDEASVESAVRDAEREAGSIDVVVNNAGYALAGLAETATAQQVLDELNTNVVGAHRVNRAVLPKMRARRSGLLIHLSSVFGRTVVPFVGVYSASKWALEALAETYRYELKLSGVDVAIVQPGPFPTPGIADKTQLGADADRAEEYGPFAHGLERMGDGLRQMFSMPNGPNPQEVADAVLELVDAPQGKRTARVVVHRFTGDEARTLNTAHDEVQRRLLAGMGLPFLAD